MDYKGNSNKDKDPKTPKKEIQKVISTDVAVQKKSLGTKFKDLFIEADFKSVSRYVIWDVLLPAARNTMFDALTKGGERMLFGDSAIRRRNLGPSAGPRVTYNAPINRGYRGDAARPASRVPMETRSPRHSREDFILSSREEAELVLERMNDIIDTYDVVSVADLNDLVGFPTNFTDNKWGWLYLGDVQIQQIREGYLINLPQAEPIQ